MPTLTFAADTSRALMDEVTSFVTNFLTPQPKTLDEALAWINATFDMPEGIVVDVMDTKAVDRLMDDVKEMTDRVKNVTAVLAADADADADEQAAPVPAPRRRHRAKPKPGVNVVTQDQRNDETGDSEGTPDAADETPPEPSDPFAPTPAPVVMNAAAVINWTPAQYLDKGSALARKVFEKGDLAKAEVITLVQSFNVKTIGTIPEDSASKFWDGMVKLSEKYAVAVS
jgi:hypothetical protein